MAHIEYHFSTISPAVYLAGTRLERIAERHGATITFRPLDVLTLFQRTGGLPPGDRHPNRQAYRLQDLQRVAEMEGLPLNPKPQFFPTNPAPSSYAVIAAQDAGGGDLGTLVHTIARAVWAEERNIAEDYVIRACLEEAGFAPSLVDSGLLSGAEAYTRNTEEAVAAGVFGVPFYITDDDERFWGQDRLGHLDHHLGKG